MRAANRNGRRAEDCLPYRWDVLSVLRILLSKRGYLLFGCSSAAMEPEAPVYERIVLKVSGEAMQQHGGRRRYVAPAVLLHSFAAQLETMRS